MITLVVKEPGQADRVFQQDGQTLVIGRAEDSDLVLPNISVSRQHASITASPDGAQLEDLFSENGIMVNGIQAKKQSLQPGDTFQVGRYSIVFVATNDQAPVYNGRLTETMPQFHSRESINVQDPTYRYSPEMVKKLMASRRLSTNAGLLNENDADTLWRLGEGTRTLGRLGSTIEIQGLFLGKTAAEISWTGTGHQIKKVTTWGTLKVNDRKVTERLLQEGDVLQIGSSQFHYVVKE